MAWMNWGGVQWRFNHSSSRRNVWGMFRNGRARKRCLRSFPLCCRWKLPEGGYAPVLRGSGKSLVLRQLRNLSSLRGRRIISAGANSVRRGSGCEHVTGPSTRHSEVSTQQYAFTPDITDALRFRRQFPECAVSLPLVFIAAHALHSSGCGTNRGSHFNRFRFAHLADMIPLAGLCRGCHPTWGWTRGCQSGCEWGQPLRTGSGAHPTERLNENFEVRQSNAPRDIELLEEPFYIALVLETFEYLEPTPLENLYRRAGREKSRKLAFL